MRPALERELPLPADTLLSRMHDELSRVDCRCTGTVAGEHVELLIKPQRRHFWSPWLSAEVRAAGAERAVLEGRFGPHPALWTGIAAAYAVLLFSAIGALMYGFSQWMIDEPPWALAAVPIAGLLALGVYLGGLVGRRLASEQIGWMLRLIDCSLDGHDDCAGGDRCVSCPLWSPPGATADVSADTTDA